MGFQCSQHRSRCVEKAEEERAAVFRNTETGRILRPPLSFQGADFFSILLGVLSQSVYPLVRQDQLLWP